MKHLILSVGLLVGGVSAAAVQEMFCSWEGAEVQHTAGDKYWYLKKDSHSLRISVEGNAAAIDLLVVSNAASAVAIDARAAFEAGATKIVAYQGSLDLVPLRGEDVMIVSEWSGTSGAKVQMFVNGSTTTGNHWYRNATFSPRDRRREYRQSFTVDEDVASLGWRFDIDAPGKGPVLFYGARIGFIEELEETPPDYGTPELLFHASFDDETAVSRVGGRSVEPAVQKYLTYEDGRRGKAVCLSAAARSRLGYAVSGNLRPECGTVSFWYKRHWESDPVPGYRVADTSTIDNAKWRMMLVLPTPGKTVGSGYLTFWWWGTGLRRDLGDLDNSMPIAGGLLDGEDETGWRHYVITWGAQGSSVFVDGEPQATSDSYSPQTAALQVSSGLLQWERDPAAFTNFFVGCEDANGSRACDGLIDEFKIFSAPLTAEEAKALYLDEIDATVSADAYYGTEDVAKSIAVRAEALRDTDLSDVVPVLTTMGGTVVASGAAFDATGGTRTVTATLAAGEYLLKLSGPAGRTPVHTSKPYWVLKSTNAVTAPPTGTPGEPSAKELIAEIAPDPAALGTDAFASVGEYATGTLAGTDYLEAGGVRGNRLAFRLPLDLSAPLHLVEIDYPDDRKRTMDVVIHNRTSSRSDYTMQVGVFGGDEVACTGTILTHRCLYWTGAEDAALILMTARDGAPAAVSRIRVYRVPGGTLPSLAPAAVTASRHRSVGGYWEDPAINYDFRADHSSAASLDLLIDRKAALMKYCGMDTLLYPGAFYHGAIAQDRSYNPRNHALHFTQAWYERFDREGLSFVPTVNLQTIPFPDGVCTRTAMRDGSLHDTSISIFDTGRPNWGGWHGTPPYFNIGHADTQAAISGIFDVLVADGVAHPSFKGVCLHLTSITCPWWGALANGYNDYNIAAFEKATGIAVGVTDRTAALRGADYATWIKANAYDAWIAWRCGVVTEFYAALAARLASARPDLKLYVNAYPTASAADPDFGTVGYRARLLREAGIDVAQLTARIPNLVFGATAMPCGYRKGLITGATGEPARAYYDYGDVMDALADAPQPWIQLHDQYWEDAVGEGSTAIRSSWMTETPWRVSTLNPTGRNALRDYVRPLRFGDLQGVSRGGFLIGTYGMEKPFAEFARAFGALPAETFATVQAGDVTVRGLTVQGRTWLYCANTTDREQTADVTFAPEAADVASGETVGIPRYRTVRSVTLAPYELRTFAAPEMDEANPPAVYRVLDTLSGGETPVDGNVYGLGAVEPQLGGSGALSGVVVNGTVSFAPETTVRLPDGAALKGGVYEILRATAFANAAETTFRLVAPSGCRATLVVGEKTLSVRVPLEATWTSTTTGEKSYAAVANWAERATGAAVAVAPTNAGDVAWFVANSNCWQSVRLPSIQNATAPNQMGTLYGTWHTKLLTATVGDNAFRYFTYLFDDLSGFQGTLTTERTGAKYAFTGATQDVHVADLVVRLRPTVDVPADTTVTVDARHGHGAVVKSGDGTLKLGETAVPDSQIVYHNKGRLELIGHADGDIAVPGDPVFWVDAARTDTMDLAEPDENGRRFISKWNDCRFADGVHTKAATPINNAALSKPWLSAEKLNGHTTVNFGANNGGDVAKYGPGASLTYALGRKAREVFIVWRDGSDDKHTETFFLGETGAYTFHRGSNGALINTGYSVTAPVSSGLIRLDGNNAAGDSKPAYGYFHMLHYAFCYDGLQPNTFFNDRTTTRYGGGRLAEAIFYTNTLTQVERVRVERYLQKKWFGADSDAEMVRTAGEATPVSVPEGNVAKVRQLVVGGAKLVKEGGGVLKVGRFQPASPTIDVAGGAVAFDESQPTVGTDAPADGAAIWLDATKDTFEFKGEPEGGTNFIARWNDCRAGSTAYASRMDSWNYPFVSSDSCNGLRVVDFGEKANAGTKAAMSLSCGNVIVEAYQVVKMPVRDSNQNIFGCSGQDLLRENTSTLLNGTHAYLAPGMGLWTMNGETVDPFANYAIDPNTWYVASFSCGETCNCIYLANERNNKIGDQRIGEFIGYKRRLTDAERRRTIAYLMKKWKGVDMSYAKPPAAIKEMNFTEENAAPTVLADVDTEIASVTFAGQTSFAKKGAGALTVDASFPVSVTDYSVEGDCTVKGPISPFADAALHFDATQLDTFAFRAGQEADRRIDRWYDCRGNGKYAKCNFDYSRTNAVLATTGAEGAGGVLPNRPYVDFGTAAGMYWYGADDKQLTMSNTREYHVVFMITGTGNHQPIGGDQYPSVAYSICPSGNLVNMFWGSACENAKGAAKKIDDSAWYRGNGWLPGGSALSTTKFYVQSVAATNNLRTCSFAIDRGNCGHGYVKLCEAIVFTGATNTTERAEAIHAYLLNKWKGLGANPISVGIDKVEVAAGGSLSLKSRQPFSVASLTGGGTLNLSGAAVKDVSSVEAGFDADGQVAGPTVSGDVTFADAVTVRVSVANPKAIRGTYTVFTADSLANVDDVDFDVQVENPGRNAYRLVKTSTSLQLEVLPPGDVIIIR